MCVLAFAWSAHPRWRLVMAGNRDELHTRPAAPLARWEQPHHVLAGRDLEAGGAWLGVSEKGRFAVVTNLRGFGTPRDMPASRGALVADLLTGDGPYARPELADLAEFNPFNLIVADPHGAHFITNRPQPIKASLAPGLYGLSNGGLDEPWPKTLQLKAALWDWIGRDNDDYSALFDVLASRALPDFGLPPDAPSEMPEEPRLSPIFIQNPRYGTRCSTVVTIDIAGNGRIAERRFTPDGALDGETSLDFQWPVETRPVL